MPLLGQDPGSALHLKSIPDHAGLEGQSPLAILMVSAHWEAAPLAVSSSEHPAMLFDYGG